MNLDTLDKSFLRLVTDFSVAKSELMTNSDNVYKDTIVISPNEIYTQISNSLTSIAFDDSYIVELVDCSDNVMLDITSKIYINEFQDINGIYQIAFEVAPIEVDYYFKKLFFRFKHLGSDLVVWSNSFILTDYVESIRLDYKNYAYYQGISYDRANIYQSIRIAAYYNSPTPKDNTKINTSINGDIRVSRPIMAIEYNYNIDETDTFTFDRLLTVLNSQIVYLNGIRFKKSETISNDDRTGLSNQFPASFKGQFEPKDTYIADYQIAPAFSIVNLYPLGLYNLVTSSFGFATSDFNMNILSSTDFSLYDYDTDAFIQLIPYNLVDNSVELDFTAISLGIGNYYISTILTSVLGQVLNITDKYIWKFSIADGEFDNTEFDNGEFFTN